MNTITIGHVKGNKIARVAKRIFDSLKSYRENTGMVGSPIFLDPQALGALGISPEEVESKLRQPPWRYIGRLL